MKCFNTGMHSLVSEEDIHAKKCIERMQSSAHISQIIDYKHGIGREKRPTHTTVSIPPHNYDNVYHDFAILYLLLCTGTNRSEGRHVAMLVIKTS